MISILNSPSGGKTEAKIGWIVKGEQGVNLLFSSRNELETGLTFETFQHAYFSKFASL